MAKTQLEARLKKIASTNLAPSAPKAKQTPYRPRASDRVRTYKHGYVLYGTGRCPCVVADMTERGAKVLFAGVTLLPSYVRLLIPQQGARISARVVWQDGAEAGLNFLPG